MIADEERESPVDEENYFISMTDMMTGVVFIFVIMLMYYALQFRDVTDKLAGADQTRTKILQQLERTLKERGVPVTVDTQNGILRLPDSILFDSGKYDLRPEGQRATAILAETLSAILPCYTDVAWRPKKCTDNPQSHRIESLYIEGHTDADQYNGNGLVKDNWDLSAARATNTYRALTEARPNLSQLCSRKGGQSVGSCEPILSVSGYGSERLIAIGSDDNSKRLNRRIDLRLIMVTPDAGETAAVVAKAVGAQP